MYRDDPSELTLDPMFGRKMIERRGRWVLVENTNRHPTPSYTIMEAYRLLPNDPSSFGWYQKPTKKGEYSHETLRAAKARFTRLAGRA
jgi:hypothetical protein